MKLVTYPDPQLNMVSQAIPAITPEIHKLARNMFEIMYKSNGVGLAAPQVGILKRIFVVNIDPNNIEKRSENEMIFINPQITSYEGQQEATEGCLSVPGINKIVKRANKITLEFQNIDSVNVSLNTEGYLAQVIQHEYDHLDGILFIKRLSPSEQISIKSQLNALKKQYKKQKSKSKSY